MSEYEEHWYCPNCESEQCFMFGGSMTDGICKECEKKFLRTELIEIAKQRGEYDRKIRWIERDM